MHLPSISLMCGTGWRAAAGTEHVPGDSPSKPVYFRYLTLMALHAYLSENVDTAIIECGIGGEFDSTNVLPRPTVTAITSLGIDHTAMLGSTLPEIAWHKAGIFKHGSVAFTAPQKEEAITVLQARAAEKGTQLRVVDIHPALASNEIKLGLRADFQKVNASVAIAAAAAHLRALGHTSVPDPTSSPHIKLPPEFIRGLEQVRWPGRCDIRHEPNVAWHIDGGHTMESIEVTGRWFAEQITSIPAASVSQYKAPCILIFNQQTRDASALAKALYNALQSGIQSESTSPFTHVIFTTNQTFADGYKPDLVSIISTNKTWTHWPFRKHWHRRGQTLTVKQRCMYFVLSRKQLPLRGTLQVAMLNLLMLADKWLYWSQAVCI